MIGRQDICQAPLFYSFNLDDHVPKNHLLRGIDQFLDLGELNRKRPVSTVWTFRL